MSKPPIVCDFWTPEYGKVFSGEYALDTETELIDEQQPENIPRFVIAGVYDGKKAYLLIREHLADFFRLHEGLTVVMHNAAFDLAVLDQSLGGDYDVYSFAEAGWVRDTMTLHRLYELATSGDSGMTGSSLADSCHKHLSLTVSKEEKDATGKMVRTNFGPWIDKPKELPKEYIDYLIGDIDATYRLYRRLQMLYQELWVQILRDRPFGFVDERHLRDAWKKYGPLTHDIQLKASIVLGAVTRNGLRVDTVRLNSFRKSLLDEQRELLSELHTYGYQPGKGSILALQRILQQIESNNNGVRFPRTETGKISTAAENLEPFAAEIPFIGLYRRYQEIGKLLSSFLDKMRKGKLHPKFDYLKNTGRTSAFGDISAQNLPRDERVRNLFVASPGHVFVDADYSAVEMATLAQAVLIQFGGKSAMAEAINAGADLHRLIAAKVAGKPEADVDKSERQRAKAVNFGLPGGMGVRTLREYAKQNYGVELSEEETQSLNDAWFAAFPEMEDFLHGSTRDVDLGEALADLLHLNEPTCGSATGQESHGDRSRSILGWMARKVLKMPNPCTNGGRWYTDDEIDYVWSRVAGIVSRLPRKCREDVEKRRPSEELAWAVCNLAETEYSMTATGRLRAGVTFCSQHNTIFQGLAADGAKLSMWKLWRNGYRIVNFIHDEFLIELPVQDDYSEPSEEVKRLMIEGMREVVPDVRIGVEYIVTPRWSKEM